jgi:hypothetical protein
MAIPSVIANSAGTVLNGTAPSHTIPAGWSAGDLCIAFVRCGGRTITARPTGWANVNEARGAGENIYVEWMKLASGDLGATQTWTLSNTADNQVTFFRITGQHATTPIDVTTATSEGSSSATHTSPSVTTTANDCLILRCWSNGSQLLTASSGDTGTKYYEQTSDPGATLFTSSLATAGATGTAVYNTIANRQLNTVTVGIAPTSGGGSSFAPYLHQPQTWQFVGIK